MTINPETGLPDAPRGKKWLVTRRDAFDDYDFMPWFWFPGAVTVRLKSDYAYSNYSSDTLAFARPNPKSIRRAALRIVAREARKKERRARQAARALTDSAQRRAQRKEAREKRSREKTTAQMQYSRAKFEANYGDILGSYPPKKLENGR